MPTDTSKMTAEQYATHTGKMSYPAGHKEVIEAIRAAPVPATRTVSEVISARASGGCCPAYAAHKACLCLKEAAEDVPAKKRTKSEVMAARRRPGGMGCCESYANRQGCDCLQEAVDDSSPPFKPGDVVQLKSGGCPMVVVEIIGMTGNVRTTWLDQSDNIHDVLFPSILLMADCSKPPSLDPELEFHNSSFGPKTGFE